MLYFENRHPQIFVANGDFVTEIFATKEISYDDNLICYLSVHEYTQIKAHK